MEEGKRKHWWRSPIGFLIAGLSAAALSVGIFAGAQFLAAKKSAETVLDNPAVAQSTPELPSNTGILKKTSESFRAVAKMVGPAVVHIKSTKGGKGRGPKGPQRGRRRGPGGEEDDGGVPGNPRDPFFDFFEKFGNPFMQPPDMPQTSLGSGIIIDKKGFVVTNNHVVEDASEILVALSGEKTDMKAKIVGTDPKTDLALVKIEANREFPVAEWADSTEVEVGDWAIAIGSPFDLRQTVTVGIVSAMGRNSNVLGGADYVGELIQTDAAINPGNSGGPLCTLDGKIMGVNTAIYTRSGGYMGIGFAIPSNLAKDVIGKLKTDGKIIRGWLGVYIQALDPELAKELGVKDGVAIHEVIDGSPAQEGGLNPGDVVIEVEGKAVKEVNELQRIISNFKPGQKVTMKVVSYSDKKTRTVKIKIGTVPAGDVQSKVTPEDDTPDRIGLVISEKNKDGVTVQAVQPGSLGEQIGLEPGDVIVRINRQPTKTIAAYKKALKGTNRINLEVKQKGRLKFYSLVLPE